MNPSHAVCSPELSPHIQSCWQRSGICFDPQEPQVPAFHQHCGPWTSQAGSSSDSRYDRKGRRIIWKNKKEGWEVKNKNVKYLSAHLHFISPRGNYPLWSHCFPDGGCLGGCGRWAGRPPQGQAPRVASSRVVSTPMEPDVSPEASWCEWPQPSGCPGSETGPCDRLRVRPGSAGTCEGAPEVRIVSESLIFSHMVCGCENKTAHLSVLLPTSAKLLGVWIRRSTTPDCSSWWKHVIGVDDLHKAEYSCGIKRPCLLLACYLAHLSDGVIKHSSGIVRSLSNELDLPGSWWETKLQRIQAHHLLCDLHEDGLARPPSVGV